MKLASFHVGLHLILNNIPYRIDRIFTSGMCILERLSDHALLTHSKEELMANFSEGNLIIDGDERTSINKKNHFSRDLASLTEIAQKCVLRKKEYVTAAILSLGEVPTKINLERVIRNTSEYIQDKNTPSMSSVLRWWKKWKQSNQNIMSLVDKKSGSSKSRKFNGKVEKIINEIIERDYLTPQKTKVIDVYNTVCFRIKEINKISQYPLKVPSRSQFYRMCNNLDKYECLAAREGKTVADKHFRATGSGIVTKYILERVEIDHTPLDVMVVNEKTGLVDGRPWLTSLIDKHSRIILGFEIGFEPPSELSVMRALRNAILPKTYLKSELPNLLNEWIAYGIPTSITCDNGFEFHANDLKRMCVELNIELQFCPKKQANYKGGIERLQGHLNSSVCHRIPGTTFSNVDKRGEYNSEKSARVYLNDLKKLIHEWVIDIHSHEINRITHRTPYAIWNEGLQIREPLLPESIQQLDLILTKEYTRKLNHEGVMLHGLHYNSGELALLRKRSYESYDVKVRFNPSNIQSIWVYDEVNRDYISVPCIQIEYAEDLSLKEHTLIKKMKVAQGRAEQNISSLIESKEAFTEHLRDLSNSKKIRPRQQAERHKLHKINNKLKNQYPLKNSEWDTEIVPKFRTSQREDK